MRETSRFKTRTGSLLVAGLLLSAGVIIAIPPGFVALGNSALHHNELLVAQQHFSRVIAVPAAEPWIAPFNRGVALYRQEKWAAAAADFEVAARDAPVDMACPVSLNWAAALESEADALRGSDDPHGASLRYQQALHVLASAVCPEDRPGLKGSQTDDWEESRKRISGKQSREGAPSSGESFDTGTPPDADLELHERIAQAQQERARAEGSTDPRVDGGDGERNW